jgi:DNA gyrase subunit B
VSQGPVKYDARHIQVLEGWEAIRKRPGMYIGSTGERGLHHLVFEVAGRALDEVLIGRGSCVEITLLPEGGVRVVDDGPGTPFEDGGDGEGPGLEAQLTRMNFGRGRGGPQSPVLSFCGVGVFVVSALSSRMVAEATRDGVRRVQEYARGLAETEPTSAGSAAGNGTVITFWPDPDIFGAAECSFDALADRFRELAFLNPVLDISLTDKRRPAEARSLRFRSPGGVLEMVAFLDEQTALVHPDIITFEQEDARMSGTAEVALRWHCSTEERVCSFANSQPTPGGGTHVMGFLDGMRSAVNAYARARGLLTEADTDLADERISEGLTAVVSVKLEHPEFEGATRGVLGNRAVRACVREAVTEHLGRWLEEHSQQAAGLVDRFVHGVRQD